MHQSWARFFVPMSRLMISPWMISVHLFICRGIPLIKSLTLILGWHWRILWSLISIPAWHWPIQWSPIRPSPPTLQWFTWLLICLHLLQLLAIHHPRFMVMDSFTPVSYPADVGMLGLEDVEMILPMVSGTDTFRSIFDLDGVCRVDHENSLFCW